MYHPTFGHWLQVDPETETSVSNPATNGPAHGWLDLQVHVGPPMLVQFRDIHLRRF